MQRATMRVVFTSATMATTEEQINAQAVYDPTESMIQYSGKSLAVHFKVVFGGTVACTQVMNVLAESTPLALKKILQTGVLMVDWVKRDLRPTAIALQHSLAISCTNVVTPTMQPTKVSNPAEQQGEDKLLGEFLEKANAATQKYFQTTQETASEVFLGDSERDMSMSSVPSLTGSLLRLGMDV